MKKLILIQLVFLFIISCAKDIDKIFFNINNFSKVQIDTLIPKKNKSYHTSYIKVKGFANDSILIKGSSINNDYNYFNIKLSGNLDTIIRRDYYGGSEIIFIFNPYLATKGKLKIKYSL